MLADFLKGASYLLTGARLLRAPGLKRFVIVPLLVSAMIFTGGLWLTSHWVANLVETLVAWLPSWLEWLRYLLWPLFAVVALTVAYFGFTLLANLIAAPFNGWLAEAVAQQLSGERPRAAAGARAWLAEITAALRSEAGKAAYFLLWGIPCLLALFVPVLGAFVWFLYGAWVVTCNYADFPMGNAGLHFAEQRRQLASRKALSFGFGIATLCLTLVPLLNFIAMPAAVAGATAMYLRELRPHNPSRDRPSA